MKAIDMNTKAWWIFVTNGTSCCPDGGTVRPIWATGSEILEKLQKRPNLLRCYCCDNFPDLLPDKVLVLGADGKKFSAPDEIRECMRKR